MASSAPSSLVRCLTPQAQPTCTFMSPCHAISQSLPAPQARSLPGTRSCHSSARPSGSPSGTAFRCPHVSESSPPTCRQSLPVLPLSQSCSYPRRNTMTNGRRRLSFHTPACPAPLRSQSLAITSCHTSPARQPNYTSHHPLISQMQIPKLSTISAIWPVLFLSREWSET